MSASAQQADRRRLLGTAAQWAAVVLCVGLGVALFTFVDLDPRVEMDFFFSSDDPQLQSSLRIEQEFGYAPQVFIAARAPRIATRAYVRRVHELTEDLRRVEGVADVRSITRGPKEPDKVLEADVADVYEDLNKRPFWRRLLLARDHSATFLVLRLTGPDNEATVAGIDQVLDEHARDGFELGASGAPYVAEHIRRRLADDLRRFSIAAFVAFAVLVAVLFRSLAVLLGTMVAALTACFGTFLVRTLLGMRPDILMPNLWTIAFVLTLSHVVYLAAEWRRRAGEVGSERAARDAVRLTGPASGWSLVANLLGFASLVFVSAQPLRQFGISGGIAAVLAMACAYGIFPLFLRSALPPKDKTGPIRQRVERFALRRHPIVATLTVLGAAVLAPFAWRVNSDPSLPSYFGVKDKIRTGLEAIDLAGGSSPLDIVIEDRRGRTLDDGDMVDRLQALQSGLERHPDVGTVISIATLMGEAERPWYAFLFSWEKRLDRLDSPKSERIGRTFLSEDRRRGRFIFRMHESSRSRPRAEVLSEISGIVRHHGFREVLVGGLYPLQGELSELVEGSVVRGLGGLMATFFLIVLIVTRSFPTALLMMVCLAITPFTLFGIVGIFGMPLDIIAAPAANVALPLGIDEMIHLGYAVRRFRETGQARWPAWQKALSQYWMPILVSMIVVASGFALFLLSSFPPTRRLGILVCAGAILTDLVVLIVLPAIATWRDPAARGRGTEAARSAPS